MANTNYTGSIELTKLPQVVILKKKNKEGKEIEGLFIPIEGNHLTRGVNKDTKANDGRVYLDARIIVRDEKDQYGQDGFITKSLPSQVYKDNKDNEDFLKTNQPILGNIKNWADSAPSATTSDVATVSDEDDLPF